MNLQPSLAPSATPSHSPFAMPSIEPSFSPITSPTQSPSQSVQPSESPTEVTAFESSVIIDQTKTKSATPLLIVGACCFIVMASTGAYLFRRGSDTRRDKRKRASATYEVSSPIHDGEGIISSYNVDDGLEPQHGLYDVNYSESESGVSDVNTLEYEYDTEKRKGGGFEDLEIGRIGIDAVPNSVSIIKRNQPSNTAENIRLGTSEDNETLGSSKLRMPKSIYVPRLFQRTKEGEEANKQVVTWNRIRDEDRSPASSGYAPASVPSPMLSPFFVKGLSSILSPYGGRKKGVLVNKTCPDEKEDVSSDDPNGSFIYNHSARINIMTKPLDELRRYVSSPSSDIFANIDNTANQDCSRQNSPKTVTSKSSWEIDGSKVQPSTVMGKQQNLPTAEEVKKIYTDASWESRNHQDDDLNSLGTNGSTFLGDIHVSSKEQESAHSAGPIETQNGSGITFERELLRANRLDAAETFSFRNIFNDPKNDLYECHAPSGPLGIVVDTTPLGPRVRSLNPLSPIFGKISPGDVIVGVDEVDTVGMEAGDFWQIVSRKSNQQQRVLLILRI